MARERISLVPDEVKTEATYRRQIETGEMNPTVFATLSIDDQNLVNKILFDIATEKVNPAVSASVLEFTLFAFMRVAMKKWDNLSLTVEDQTVLDGVKAVMALHEITDGTTAKDKWMFDYLSYAKQKAGEILTNRADHLKRKTQVTGKA